MLGAFALSVSLAAEPVVLPEFSFDAGTSFALSVMLQSQLQDKLTQHGHIVLSHEMVVNEVGQDAVDLCFSNPTCPQDILPRLPSRVAIVGHLKREGGDLGAHVELWEQSRTSAMDVRDFIIRPGEETAFIEEVANATTALVGQLPPSPPEVLMSAARMIAGQPANGNALAPTPVPAPLPTPVPAPMPIPQPGVQPYPQPVPAPGVQPSPYPSPYPQPAPTQPTPTQLYPQIPPAPTGPQPLVAQPVPVPTSGDPNRVDYALVDVKDAIQGTPLRGRHLIGAEQNLIKSGFDPRTWMYKRTPHAGRVIIEPRAGIGIGDVARGADVRIAVIDGAQRNELDWFQEGPLESQGVRGELYVGFAPITFLDIGVLGGLQYGKRRFTSGFYGESNGNGELAIDGQLVNAIQFVIQPRLRFYILPFGPVKPFVYAAGDFRFFDKWNVGASEGAQFPAPPGGNVPGVAGGVGILVDPSPIVGFFVEAGYIRHFGTRAAAAQPHGNWGYDDPNPPQGSFGTIPIVGGVQFRL